MIRLRQFIIYTLIPVLVTFLLFVGAWEAMVRILEWKPYYVPSPRLVFGAAVENWLPLLKASGLTALAAVGGFVVAIVTGCLIAFLFSQSIIIQKAGYPYAIFFQTVPIIAIAPLIILWFGHDIRSVIIAAAIVSIFPIITNMTTGLTELDRNAVELFQLNDASRLQKLLKLRIPSSIPYLIAGAKTASGLSVIGAITGEFFSGLGQGRQGLGYLIYMTHSQLKIDYMFAATIASTILGLIIFVLVNFLGNTVLLRWRET